VVVTCVALNLAGIRVVGLTSVWLFFLLSLPFALIVLLSPVKTGAYADPHAVSTGASVGLLGAVLVAMWNYMGWDNRFDDCARSGTAAGKPIRER